MVCFSLGFDRLLLSGLWKHASFWGFHDKLQFRFHWFDTIWVSTVCIRLIFGRLILFTSWFSFWILIVCFNYFLIVCFCQGFWSSTSLLIFIVGFCMGVDRLLVSIFRSSASVWVLISFFCLRFDHLLLSGYMIVCFCQSFDHRLLSGFWSPDSVWVLIVYLYLVLDRLLPFEFLLSFVCFDRLLWLVCNRLLLSEFWSSTSVRILTIFCLVFDPLLLSVFWLLDTV